ncbi:hypothetical protein AMECASPLE_012421 [Ameca splendens]|uniref:Uncharacterized protein n=1 Tax=Ameca splendens TaxID=208324 RepID=A0ABV0YC61_9TELE
MASPCLPALPSPAAGSLLMPSGGTARLVCFYVRLQPQLPDSKANESGEELQICRRKVRVVPHHPGSCNVGGRHPWVYQRFDLEGITLLDIKSAAE